MFNVHLSCRDPAGLVCHCIASFYVTGILAAEQDLNLNLRIAAKRWVESRNNICKTILKSGGIHGSNEMK